MGGAPSDGGLPWLDADEGASPAALWPAEVGRSANARGAVGGGLPDALSGGLSDTLELRGGTVPKAGADGATGGGETSFAAGGGS